MPVTRRQAELIAELMRDTRHPKGQHWDIAGCIYALGHVKHRNLAEVIHAAIRLAETIDAQTPMALAQPGPQWSERSLIQPTGSRHIAGGCAICSQPEATCRRTPPDVSGHTYQPPGTHRPIPNPNPRNSVGSVVEGDQ